MRKTKRQAAERIVRGKKASREKANVPQPSDTANLDYWTFVDHAVKRTSRRIPDVVAPPMLMLMTLRRATNVIFYDMHVKLTKESSISSAAALTLLLVLSVCGPMEMREVVRLSGQSRATVSALADGLVKQGLLNRVPREEDRRVVLLEMTKLGDSMFDEAFRVFNKQEQFWAASLTREEQATLVSLLRKMVIARWDDSRVDRRN